jgi:hypothetical protein
MVGGANEHRQMGNLSLGRNGSEGKNKYASKDEATLRPEGNGGGVVCPFSY